MGRQASPPISNKRTAQPVPSPSQKYAEDRSPTDAELRERSHSELEMMLQAVVEACPSNVAVLNNSGTIIAVNKAWRLFAAQHRLTAERYGVGLDYLEMCQGVWGASAEGAAAVAGGIRRVLDGEETEFTQEYLWQSPTAQRWFLMRAARFDLPGACCAFRILVTQIDITERKRTEEALRNLGGRLIGAQEEERRRVARELHDDLNQRMALLAIELEQLAQKIPERQSDLRACVQDLWAKTREISSEIHRLSYQLHPSKLDHLGLAAAVKSFCDELADHHEIKIEFRHRGFPAILPKEVTLCLFRIVQESLSNVIKHSGSREAHVLLEREEQSVRLFVSDTGCGFDPESTQSQNGLGFISMRERLRPIGGEISIHSQLSRGTQIAVSVPLIEPIGI